MEGKTPGHFHDSLRVSSTLRLTSHRKHLVVLMYYSGDDPTSE